MRPSYRASGPRDPSTLLEAPGLHIAPAGHSRREPPQGDLTAPGLTASKPGQEQPAPAALWSGTSTPGSGTGNKPGERQQQNASLTDGTEREGPGGSTRGTDALRGEGGSAGAPLGRTAQVLPPDACTPPPRPARRVGTEASVTAGRGGPVKNPRKRSSAPDLQL